MGSPAPGGVMADDRKTVYVNDKPVSVFRWAEVQHWINAYNVCSQRQWDNGDSGNTRHFKGDAPAPWRFYYSCSTSRKMTQLGRAKKPNGEMLLVLDRASSKGT